MDAWQDIERELAARSGRPVTLGRPVTVGGGSINTACRVDSDDGCCFFVKFNRASRLDMFAAEAEGLEELRQAPGLRIPEPLAWGVAGGQAYLVMEHLPLGGRGSSVELAQALAAMHRITAPRFGWRRDNTIGSTPQPNDPCDDWLAFWAQRRLGYQLQMAVEGGAGRRLETRGGRLLEQLPALMDGRQPEASLLHGDLWSGNASFTRDGEPAIFDPAVYYGDREADLAMTELFGGFGADFYAAYQDAWPLEPGYPVRKTLYNLYHILNHYNMFGGGYLDQALHMIDDLLSHIQP